ncbi:MAG: hypothetical protein AB1458_00855 [Bacteroidota bacterium]
MRQLLIYGMTRQQQINFIVRKDSGFTADSFAGQTNKQVLHTALSVDKKVQADKFKK